jgi:uncharacterized Zn-binding protein involved in type VI secretion
MPGAAVVDVSIASGSILVSGAESIIVNNHPLGYLSSVNSKGVTVVAGSTTVKAENKQAARVSDAMSNGGTVTTGSPDVFIGDDVETNTPANQAMADGDETDAAEPGSGIKYIATQIAAGKFTARDIAGLARASTISPGAAEVVPPRAQGPVSTDCGDLHDQIGNYPGILIDKLPLTANFTLGSITRAPNITFDHPVRPGSTVLGFEQTLCNLKLLAINCIEPIKAKFPNLHITNSWRPAGIGSPTSQHPKGQAFDMQFRGVHPKEYFTICQWIRDNVAYDQLLLEYKTTGTRLPWIHLSFDSAKSRRQVLTLLNDVTYAQGLTQLA